MVAMELHVAKEKRVTCYARIVQMIFVVAHIQTLFIRQAAQVRIELFFIDFLEEFEINFSILEVISTSTDDYLTNKWSFDCGTMFDEIGSANMIQGYKTYFVEDRFCNQNSARNTSGLTGSILKL